MSGGFKDLDVLSEMLSAGGDRISETVFYSQNGKRVSVPSKWFGGGQDALGISRAEMDFRLLEKARSLGVRILEETQVIGLLSENQEISGVKARFENRETTEIFADLTIDATGRANVLGKLVEKGRRGDGETGEKGGDEEKGRRGDKFQNSKLKTPKTQIQKPKAKNQKSKLIGFAKTHLENVHLEKGVCEIYFFRGGYGGLSFVENDRANHCFLIKAEVVREFANDAGKILENVIFQNRRARAMMREAVPVFDWLAVSVDGFGKKNLTPAEKSCSLSAMPPRLLTRSPEAEG